MAAGVVVVTNYNNSWNTYELLERLCTSCFNMMDHLDHLSRVMTHTGTPPQLWTTIGMIKLISIGSTCFGLLHYHSFFCMYLTGIVTAAMLTFDSYPVRNFISMDFWRTPSLLPSAAERIIYK